MDVFADAFQKASSGTSMATKPGLVTTATGGAAGSTSVGTAGKVAAELKAEVVELWINWYKWMGLV